MNFKSNYKNRLLTQMASRNKNIFNKIFQIPGPKATKHTAFIPKSNNCKIKITRNDYLHLYLYIFALSFFGQHIFKNVCCLTKQSNFFITCDCHPIYTFNPFLSFLYILVSSLSPHKTFSGLEFIYFYVFDRLIKS